MVWPGCCQLGKMLMFLANLLVPKGKPCKGEGKQRLARPTSELSEEGLLHNSLQTPGFSPKS